MRPVIVVAVPAEGGLGDGGEDDDDGGGDDR